MTYPYSICEEVKSLTALLLRVALSFLIPCDQSDSILKMATGVNWNTPWSCFLRLFSLQNFIPHILTNKSWNSYSVSIFFFHLSGAGRKAVARWKLTGRVRVSFLFYVCPCIPYELWSSCEQQVLSDEVQHLINNTARLLISLKFTTLNNIEQRVRGLPWYFLWIS